MRHARLDGSHDGARSTALTPQLPGDRPAPNPRATRSVVMARNGAIATSQPLATAAGLKVLQSGGNAIDAAVTAAAVLSVVEPTMNGIGGDLFAIALRRQERSRSTASTRADARRRPRRSRNFRSATSDRIPLRGPLSVSVPGVVDGWNELLTKHGTITLAQALEPAIRYARDGYGGQRDRRRGNGARSLTCWRAIPNGAAVLLPSGKPPAAGDVFKNPALAASLEQIAKGGRDAFYQGPDRARRSPTSCRSAAA